MNREIPHIGICIIFQLLEGGENLLLVQRFPLRRVAIRCGQNLQGLSDIEPDVGDGIGRKVKESLEDFAVDDLEVEGRCNCLERVRGSESQTGREQA